MFAICYVPSLQQQNSQATGRALAAPPKRPVGLVPFAPNPLAPKLQNQQMLAQHTCLLLAWWCKPPPLLSRRGCLLRIPPLLRRAWLLLPVRKGHGPLLLLRRVAASHRRAWGCPLSLTAGVLVLLLGMCSWHLLAFLGGLQLVGQSLLLKLIVRHLAGTTQACCQESA